MFRHGVGLPGLLLLVYIVAFHGTRTKSLEISYRYDTAYACEGKTLKIECRDGELIKLIRANYGRFSITICNDHGNTDWSVNCMSPKSLRVLHSRCSEFQNCSIPASTSMFDDPCPGTLKYLEAHYQCLPASTTTTTSRPSPPWLSTSQPPMWSTMKTSARPPPSPVRGGGTVVIPPAPAAHTPKTAATSSSGSSTSTSSAAGAGTATTPASTRNSASGDHHHHHSGGSSQSSVPVKVQQQQPVVPLKGPPPPVLPLPEDGGGGGKPHTDDEDDEEDDEDADEGTLDTDHHQGEKGFQPVKDGSRGPTVSTTTGRYNGLGGSTSFHIPSTVPSAAAAAAAAAAAGANSDTEADYCAPVTLRNIYWNWTRAGHVNIQSCPGGTTGFARWRCIRRPSTLTTPPASSSANGDGNGGSHHGSATLPASVWWPATPDLSECRSVWLTSLEQRVLLGKDRLISITSDLAQVTSSKTLYGGDMMITTKIIQKMAQKMNLDIQTFPDPRQREAIVTEMLHDVVRTGSNLLDAAQHPSWRDLSHTEQMRVATSLLIGLEENAFLLAETVMREKTVDQMVKNIMLSVRVLDARAVTTETFPSASSHQHWPTSNDTIELPQDALLENSDGGLVRLVFVAFDRLEEILQWHPVSTTAGSVDHHHHHHRNHNTGPTSSTSNPPLSQLSTSGNAQEQQMHGDLDQLPPQRVLNSKVISASLGKGRHIQLREAVRLTLRHLQTDNVSNPSCVFWDYTTSAWSEEGCHVDSTNRTHTVCLCNHLTNFAILMDVHAVQLPLGHRMALQIITYVGCITSAVCLVMAVVTFQLVRGLKSDRTTIHCNLCICLLIAEILFLTFVERTQNRIFCGVIAALLQYFFLCSFMWMFFEGFQLYVMLIEVFEAEKSRIRLYYLIAYTVPALIVGISYGISQDSYGTELYCWLQPDNYFIYTFIVPVCFILMLNFIFLVMAIVTMCRHSNTSVSMKNKEHSRLASARIWLRGAFMLMFLLGLTWTFGLLYINVETVVMAYLFAIFNTLQGFFIFLFHCVQNDKARKEYRKFIRRHNWLPKCLRCSKPGGGGGGSGNATGTTSGSNPTTGPSTGNNTHSTGLTNNKELPRSVTHYSSAGNNAGLTAAAAAGASNTAVGPGAVGNVMLGGAAGVIINAHGSSNISFKSYSRDSGHGGSEQEDSSPRGGVNLMNNAKDNNTASMRRGGHQHHLQQQQQQQQQLQAQPFQDITIANNLQPSNEYGTNRHHPKHLALPNAPPLNLNIVGQQQQQQSLRASKKNHHHTLRGATSPYHTYSEIQEARMLHHHHQQQHLAAMGAYLEDDPVYEEIERRSSEIQISDVSDEEGRRQSDMSRQSSRSYGDHRPLIPYSPAASAANDRNILLGGGGSHMHRGDTMRSLAAVLDGQTVVCHLEPPMTSGGGGGGVVGELNQYPQQGNHLHHHHPQDSYNSRTLVYNGDS